MRRSSRRVRRRCRLRVRGRRAGTSRRRGVLRGRARRARRRQEAKVAAMIGKVLDSRYRIDKLLGQGGMGAVYEATHTGTGRRVAVKLIQQIALGDTDVFARFQREARASSAVDTRHIVEVL